MTKQPAAIRGVAMMYLLLPALVASAAPKNRTSWCDHVSIESAAWRIWRTHAKNITVDLCRKCNFPARDILKNITAICCLVKGINMEQNFAGKCTLRKNSKYHCAVACRRGKDFWWLVVDLFCEGPSTIGGLRQPVIWLLWSTTVTIGLLTLRFYAQTYGIRDNLACWRQLLKWPWTRLFLIYETATWSVTNLYEHAA